MKGEVDAMIVGKQSILFEENVYIEETACVAGQKESEGPLGKLFDVVVEDAMAGMENWEEAESTLQQLAVDKLLEKWQKRRFALYFCRRSAGAVDSHIIRADAV